MTDKQIAKLLATFLAIDAARKPGWGPKDKAIDLYPLILRTVQSLDRPKKHWRARLFGNRDS